MQTRAEKTSTSLQEVREKSQNRDHISQRDQQCSTFIFFFRTGPLLASSLCLQATSSPTWLIFTKMGNTAAFCISSPLCNRVTGVAGSTFAVRQLHPAGCVLGSPVCCVGALPPGRSSARREGTAGGCFTQPPAWLLSLYHMHLTSFRFCGN